MEHLSTPTVLTSLLSRCVVTIVSATSSSRRSGSFTLHSEGSENCTQRLTGVAILRPSQSLLIGCRERGSTRVQHNTSLPTAVDDPVKHDRTANELQRELKGKRAMRRLPLILRLAADGCSLCQRMDSFRNSVAPSNHEIPRAMYNVLPVLMVYLREDTRRS